MVRGGQNLIKGRNCPKCGYDLRGREQAAQVQCPECGRVHDYSDLSIGPPLPPLVRPFAVIAHLCTSSRLAMAVIVVACFALVLLPAIQGVLDQGRGGRLPPRQAMLRNIATAQANYACENGDRYPEHPASLLLSGDMPLDLVFDHTIPPSKQRRWFGSVSLQAYDGTDDAWAALQAQLESVNTTRPWFRFGDVYFARRPSGFTFGQVWSATLLIDAWTVADKKGTRWALFADGHVEKIESASWARIWTDDARARRKSGLTPIAIPP